MIDRLASGPRYLVVRVVAVTQGAVGLFMIVAGAFALWPSGDSAWLTAPVALVVIASGLMLMTAGQLLDLARDVALDVHAIRRAAEEAKRPDA